LIKAGKIEEALGELKMCEEYLPGDISMVIEMGPVLRSAGREKEMVEMVERTVARLRGNLAVYPKAARIHNSVAWMVARCGVRLDVGLEHALKAVELEPKSAALWDTLGEVYFQMGEREKALEAIKVCIELEPGVERHRAQLKRIQAGARESEPPQ
jgi:tetratricopeptide (TPR) repeat protein